MWTLFFLKTKKIYTNIFIATNIVFNQYRFPYKSLKQTHDCFCHSNSRSETSLHVVITTQCIMGNNSEMEYREDAIINNVWINALTQKHFNY